MFSRGRLDHDIPDARAKCCAARKNPVKFENDADT